MGDLVEQINVLAELRQQEGDFRKAESLYREALFRIQDTKTPDGDLMVGVHSLLAYLNDRQGKPTEAASHYQKALQLSEEMGVKKSEKVATVKNNLAILLKGMRNYQLAATYYLEALSEFFAVEGPNSPHAAGVYNNLGVLYYQNMEVEKSLDVHLRAQKIRDAVGVADLEPGEVGLMYFNLSAAYKAMGDFQHAHETMEKAQSLQAANSGVAMPAKRRVAALSLDRVS